MKNKTADRKSFIFLGFNAYKESLTGLDRCFFYLALIFLQMTCAHGNQMNNICLIFFFFTKELFCTICISSWIFEVTILIGEFVTIEGPLC